MKGYGVKSNRSYFFQTLPYIVSKLNVTLTLTIINAVFSLIVRMVFTVISYYGAKGVSRILEVWISFVCGISAVAQLFFFYHGLANLSSLILNMFSTVATAVIMSLSIGVFVSESVRGTLISTDEG